MEEKLIAIMNEMTEYLSVAQLKKLQEVLLKHFAEDSVQKQVISNDEYLKNISGCQENRRLLRANTGLLRENDTPLVKQREHTVAENVNR